MIRRYPSLFCLTFVVPGIILADQIQVASWYGMFGGLLILGAAGYCLHCNRRKAGILLLGLMLGVLAFGLYSLMYVDIGPHHLKRIIKPQQTCRIYGQVADWPDLKPDRTELKIAVDSVFYDVMHRVEGGLLLKVTDTSTALQRGDRIEFRGRIYRLPPIRNSGEFEYGRYLNLKGLHGIVYLPTLLGVTLDARPTWGYLNLVDNLRASILDCFNRNLMAIPASLAGGFLIGETRHIPPSIYTMFRDSGTLHLLAVSGSNVALVLLFFIFVLRPFKLKPVSRSLFLLGVVVLFAGLSYGEPSVMRASVMAALVIVARLTKRHVDLNNIIALAALIILLVDPAQLFDVGFQLSFITAWGLILLVPKLAAPFKRYHQRLWYKALVFPFLIAAVAQVCSAPLIAYYFERIPAVSVAANLVIVPMVSLAVIGVLGLLIADLIFPLLGFMAGSLVNAWLNLVLDVLKGMSSENMPQIDTGQLLEGVAGLFWVGSFYVLLLLMVWAISNKPARRIGLTGALLVLNLALAGAAVADADKDEITIRFNTVPGGLVAIMTSPGSTSCDLILTGLNRRGYAVDDKILGPMLRRQSLSHIEKLLVLNSDYDAIDDILRLANEFSVAELLVSARLKASFQDGMQSTRIDLAKHRVSYFDEPVRIDDQSGYYLERSAICLKAGRNKIIFVDRLHSELFDPDAERGGTVLAIGSKWSPSPDDLARFSSLGFARIVCSKFEQVGSGAYYEADLDPNASLPDPVVDLSVRGSYVLTIPISHISRHQ